MHKVMARQVTNLTTLKNMSNIVRSYLGAQSTQDLIVVVPVAAGMHPNGEGIIQVIVCIGTTRLYGTAVIAMTNGQPAVISADFSSNERKAEVDFLALAWR